MEVYRFSLAWWAALCFAEEQGVRVSLRESEYLDKLCVCVAKGDTSFCIPAKASLSCTPVTSNVIHANDEDKMYLIISRKQMLSDHCY